jgi:pyruvate/2-oxoglutarate dehydrogenase complex dihydrolipoamide acyltransferase (E2) component
MDMVEGTFVEWFKAEGDTVALGEPLAEVETDKATANLEAPVAGTLKQILVPTGATVEVQAVVAIIDEASP